ncbi:hypothetical protein DW886_19130 [Enterocloster aldenensis]|nr:hypothetical protein DW886_19130 [Enterocloster aldenensis]
MCVHKFPIQKGGEESMLLSYHMILFQSTDILKPWLPSKMRPKNEAGTSKVFDCAGQASVI